MEKYLPIIKKAIEDKLGNNVVILDVSSLTPICDYIVIADAANVNHLDAVEDGVTKELAKAGILPKIHEGESKSGWILIDYNGFIIHLFTNQMRKFYDLERIWGDGKEVKIED